MKNPKVVPHTEVIVQRFPPCDFCTQRGIPYQAAHYDCKTIYGPWANMCEEHFRAYGRGLGLGKGQRLVLEE